MFGGPTPSFGTIEAADGTALRTAVWQPTTAEPRGTVVLLQGRIEFIEKYCETAADLLDRGFAVFSLDWRGQGESARALADRHKDYVGDYAEFLSDFDLFLETVVLPVAPKPIFVMAHSMGGHITLRHLGESASRGESYFAERVVLCAPMVDIAVSPLMRFVATVLTAGASLLNLEDRYAPGGGGYVEMPFDDNPLTRDRGRFDRTEAMVRENPALALGWPTYGWVAATRQSIATLRGPGYPEAIRTPVLLLSAGADTVVSNKAQAKLAARMPNCQFESVPDARHELLMETVAVRQQFFGYFDAFLGLSRGDTA